MEFTAEDRDVFMHGDLENVPAVMEDVRVLGEGAFGEVMLRKDPKSGILLAVKIVDMLKNGDKGIEALRKEALLHRKLTQQVHPNVIKFVGLRVDHDLPLFEMFLEYADGGELFDRIEPDVGVPHHIAQHYFRQLIDGLDYLHKLGVAHRDIKPENLFLTKTDVLKIGDFGLATIFRIHGRERTLDSCCGTYPYASPQVLDFRYKGPPTDVWSAGIVLHTLLTGQLPWDMASTTQKEYVHWLEHADIYPWNRLDHLTLDFLHCVLHPIEKQRATTDEIRKHKWFFQFIPVEDTPSRTLFLLQASQPVSHCAISETRTEKAKPAAVAFSQPENVLYISQDYDHNLDHFANLASRVTRFCVSVDYGAFVERLAEAAKEVMLELKEKPNSSIVLIDHARNLAIAVSIYPVVLDGQPRCMIDFRRSKGDGLRFKRVYNELRRILEPIVCKEATTDLEGVYAASLSTRPHKSERGDLLRFLKTEFPDIEQKLDASLRCAPFHLDYVLYKKRRKLAYDISKALESKEFKAYPVGGSCNGLFRPDSDIDVVMMPKKEQPEVFLQLLTITLVRRLMIQHSRLLSGSKYGLESYLAIVHARVPILSVKLKRPSGISVDVQFGNADTIKTTNHLRVANMVSSVA
ncbi:unnamed protein product, partial [Mesorhabditis spiculigera]